MQVKELKKENLQREYAVTIEASVIDAKIEEELKSVGNQVKIPGFRPGKIPMKVLRQRYGKNVLGEVLEKTVQSKTTEVIKEKDDRPAMRPNVEILSFDEGKDLEFKMSYEVLPEIPKIDFSKISVEKLTYDLPDDEVEQGMNRLASYRKSYDAKAKTAKAKEGDAVRIDFKGFVDGEAFEGGEAKGHTLELGSGQFIPGFEEQLVGKKAGDECKVEVKFPEEYHSEALKGKDAIFEVTVHEVLEAKPVKMDDEFAKELGLESLDKLKESIAEQLSKDYDGVARTKLKKALFDALDDKCDFTAPESMVKAEFDAIWQRVEDAKKKGDDSFDDKPEEELRAEYQTIAERRVRLGIFLAEIGRQNDLKVNQDELSKAVIEHARQFPGQEQKVFEFYQQHPEHLEELRGPIIEEKAVDFVLDKVKITEKKVDIETLIADDEEESSSEKKPKAKKETAAKKKPAAKSKAATKKKSA